MKQVEGIQLYYLKHDITRKVMAMVSAMLILSLVAVAVWCSLLILSVVEVVEV